MKRIIVGTMKSVDCCNQSHSSFSRMGNGDGQRNSCYRREAVMKVVDHVIARDTDTDAGLEEYKRYGDCLAFLVSSRYSMFEVKYKMKHYYNYSLRG
jgi:sarcosine oxidase delta subunit